MGCTHSSTDNDEFDSVRSDRFNRATKRARGRSVYGTDISQAAARATVGDAESLAAFHHGTKKCGKVDKQAPLVSMEGRFGNVNVRYAYVSKRGKYPDDTRKPNQDSFSISDKKYCGIDNHALLSVFDGHGPDGHSCAWFVKENLHNLFEKYYKQVHAKTTKSSFHGSLPSGKPEEWPVTLMTPELYQDAAIMAHISCNEELRASKKVNDLLSGTTSISVGFHQDFMVTMNVGDSRAILGYLDDNGNMISKHLSHDQTPYRKDERERVKECGAMIRSLDQLDGLEPLHENWSDNLGNVIDEDGDPPRLWHRDGEYPGCAFTRSIGDSLAESIGVFAEPELNVKKIADKDKIVVIASDGVFEFIPSQAIIEMCAKYDNPLDACEHVVSTAYTEWLKRETRTDDITMICVFLDEIVTDDASNGDTK